MTTINRREYVEGELKKWNEEYEIPFEQVFDVKAILDLEYQFLSTPDDHIKTKSDIVHTMQRLKSGLRLKPKKNTYMISVDPFNSSVGEKISLSVDTLDNKTGELKSEYIDGVDYQDVAFSLIQIIKKIKPTKVFFDKTGKGLTLYDVVKFDLKKHDIQINNSGEITYLAE